MAKPLIVGARVPQRWQQQINVITAVSGGKEASVVREGLAQYLGKTDPGSVKGAMVAKRTASGIALVGDRVTNVERKLAGLGRLVGE